MLGKLFGLRPDDYRDTLYAFLTLVGVMTGHALLETARDALFLASLPSTLLPWAYLAIAALALGVTRLNSAAMSRYSRSRAISATLLGGALVTFGLHSVSADPAPWVLFAVYVWTGLLATVVVVQFWLHLGDVFTVGQAKRAFALIGAGGLVGAVMGSALASALLMVVPSRSLLLAAVVAFLLSAIPPMFLSKRTTTTPRRHRPIPRRLADLSKDPYLVRLFALVLLSTLLVTGVDYLFKSVVAEHVAADSLGSFFARFYAVVNLVALVVQLVLAPRLLRGLGVTGTLLVLPIVFLGGAVGFALLLGLVPALLLKATDATLRHSVNKTATEILYLPLAAEVRERVKAVTETLGRRGGQALASLAILGALFFGAEPVHIGVALAMLAALWLGCIVGLKPLYLELFRDQLREGRLDTETGLPALDLSSMEALVAALSSDNDAEVLGALDLFEEHGKTNLVPALILYHPSRDVVMRAFEIFADSNRTDVIRLTERLLKGDDPVTRAAALRLHASVKPDEEMLRSFAEHRCPAVRATALLGLMNAGFASEEEVEEELEEMIENGDANTRGALARTLRYLPADRFAPIGLALEEVATDEVRVELARSMRAAPHVGYLPALVRMLQHRDVRNDARAAMVAIGDPALQYLDRALADRTLPRVVRRHLPRTVSRFPGEQAIEVLQRRLAIERNETVIFKILRGLGRLRADNPAAEIDRDALLAHTEATLERAVVALDWRLAVEATRKAVPEATTDAAVLLEALLEEKERAALERVFRLLQILEPREEFRAIYDGLRSADAKTRASSRELLEYVVPDAVRRGILALVDDAPHHERLANAAAFHEPPGRLAREKLVADLAGPTDEVRARALYGLGLEYRERLREMLKDASSALRSIAGYHIAELGLDDLKSDVEAAAQSRDEGAIGVIAERAIGLFESIPAPRLSGAG